MAQAGRGRGRGRGDLGLGALGPWPSPGDALRRPAAFGPVPGLPPAPDCPAPAPPGLAPARPGRPELLGPGLPPAPPGPAAGTEDEERVPLAELSLVNKLIHTSLVESDQHIEILQRDPSSPLFSVKTFEELHLKKELLQGIYMAGFNRPSKIQEQALPLMLAYPPQNLIAQSQSGTGKTAAFVLAMLSRANGKEKYPQCLCLAPTYELALQIGQVVEAIGKFCTDIKVNYAVRGNQIVKGMVLEEQLIIGTPGTTLDWCFKQRVLDLGKISLFVLDEADIMMNMQGLSCQSIRIHRSLPKSCQVLLFSATYKEPVRAFAERIVPDPIVIKLREEELTLSNIRQYFMVCRDAEEQYQALCNLYGSFTIGQVMIFCQTRRLAEWLSRKMSWDGHQVAMLTAELTVVQRASVIQRFREGKEKVLIATNVCARGIDVPQVTTVVNFSLPRDQCGEPDFETYLHRIGRAGRFGHRGIAFSMVESETVALVRKIEEHFQTTIRQLDPHNMDELEKLAAE